jgi:hypothetical protein
MLVVDPDKRLTMSQIAKHRWLANTPPVDTGPERELQLNKTVIDHMLQLPNLNQAMVLQSLKNNTFDHIHAIYNLLLDKLHQRTINFQSKISQQRRGEDHGCDYLHTRPPKINERSESFNEQQLVTHLAGRGAPGGRPPGRGVVQLPTGELQRELSQAGGGQGEEEVIQREHLRGWGLAVRFDAHHTGGVSRRRRRQPTPGEGTGSGLRPSDCNRSVSVQGNGPGRLRGGLFVERPLHVDGVQQLRLFGGQVFDGEEAHRGAGGFGTRTGKNYTLFHLFYFVNLTSLSL